MSRKFYVWRKLSAAQWEDAWQERLGWLGERLVIIALAGAKTVRIEAYQLTKREAGMIAEAFGGQVRTMQPLTARQLEPAPRPPLRIRGKLTVVASEKERARLLRESPAVPCIAIPASLAFGTGDHATTATCLRVLADEAARLPAGWQALDLGTGTGILALAARALGAGRVEAADFDATAVRVARENAATNSITGIVFKKADVLAWKPAKRWPVVTANLFGPTLIAAAPQIAASVAPGGALILSGILRIQAADVVAAFEKQRIKFETITRRGKWVTCLGRATAK